LAIAGKMPVLPEQLRNMSYTLLCLRPGVFPGKKLLALKQAQYSYIDHHSELILQCTDNRVETPMITKEASLPFYEQALDFLASGPSIDEIIRFRPSQQAQN
jgi:hypothetical protein